MSRFLKERRVEPRLEVNSKGFSNQFLDFEEIKTCREEKWIFPLLSATFLIPNELLHIWEICNMDRGNTTAGIRTEPGTLFPWTNDGILDDTLVKMTLFICGCVFGSVCAFINVTQASCETHWGKSSCLALVNPTASSPPLHPRLTLPSPLHLIHRLAEALLPTALLTCGQEYESSCSRIGFFFTEADAKTRGGKKQNRKWRFTWVRVTDRALM